MKNNKVIFGLVLMTCSGLGLAEDEILLPMGDLSNTPTLTITEHIKSLGINSDLVEVQSEDAAMGKCSLNMSLVKAKLALMGAVTLQVDPCRYKKMGPVEFVQGRTLFVK